MKLKCIFLARVVVAVLCWASLSSRASAADAAPPRAASRELVIVHWNVENLFDAEDDPANKGDDPYTPRGWEHWTTNLYLTKLDHLAGILAEMNGDIVSLAEVENRRVLEDLNQSLVKIGARPYTNIIHREGPDKRGIDVAILSREAPVSVRWLSPVPLQRDIVVAEFRIAGQPLAVLANHWKSHFGPKQEGEQKRREEALAARVAIDNILSTNRSAAAVMAGDFNDNFSVSNLVENAGALTNLNAVLADKTGRALFNLHATLPAELSGTLYYRKGKTWDSFDSIIVSRNMVNAADTDYKGWRVKKGSYEVFRAARQMDEDGHPRPFRRGLDPEDDDPARRPYIEGYSDHFPLRVVLTLGQK